MSILEFITTPTFAYLFLLLGIYGIFFELLNPGLILPGLIGVTALLLALHILRSLPLNYGGLLLLVLGLSFIIAEGFLPSFGALGLGGTLAFILGSLLLIDSQQPKDQIAWSAIGAMATTNLLILIGLVVMSVKASKKKIQHGLTMLIGAQGRTLDCIEPKGQAVIRGEIWSVYAKRKIAADKTIKVLAADGLQLEVEEVINSN